MEEQFVTIPNTVAADTELELLDTLIYAVIKKFMNNKTLMCWPSIDKIQELSGLSRARVIKGIKNLKTLGYIDVSLKGRKSIYKFNTEKGFEIFSFDFLEHKDLTPTEKALQIRLQHLEIDSNLENEKVCNLSDTEAAHKIGMTKQTFSRTIKNMEAKGFLDIIPTKNWQGLTVNGKYFKLDALNQAIVYKIKNHEDRIETVEEKLEKALKEIEYLKRKDKARDIEDAKIIEQENIIL